MIFFTLHDWTRTWNPLHGLQRKTQSQCVRKLPEFQALINFTLLFILECGYPSNCYWVTVVSASAASALRACTAGVRRAGRPPPLQEPRPEGGGLHANLWSRQCVTLHRPPAHQDRWLLFSSPLHHLCPLSVPPSPVLGQDHLSVAPDSRLAPRLDSRPERQSRVSPDPAC